jgi:hypothetical protein
VPRSPLHPGMSPEVVVESNEDRWDVEDFIRGTHSTLLSRRIAAVDEKSSESFHLALLLPGS